MNWNISAWSIRQPVPSLVLFMVLIALGYVSFGQLPVTRFPNIDVPIVQVRVYQSGAAPSELEVQVTKKIEDAIAGVNGVKHQTSAVTEGSSVTTIEFRLEVNQDRALNDVKDAIARIRAELPRTIDEPIVHAHRDRGPADRHLRGARARHDARGAVLVRRRHGRARAAGREGRVADRALRRRRARDPHRARSRPAARLRHHRRRRQPAAAGHQRRPGRRPRRDRRARAGDPHARRQAVGGGPRRHHDRAAEGPQGAARPAGHRHRRHRPSRAPSPRSTAARWWPSPSRAPRAPATWSWPPTWPRRSSELQKAHPNVELKLIDSMVVYTLGAYHSTMKTLIEGAILAIVVVFIFLRDWRATLIAAIALPLSIVPAFWAIDAAGFSLNLVSLLAITIVTGILVDDAIVEIENIVRHMRMGKSPYRAALEAADEIGLAVIAITLTIIAVFVPVSFMGGIAGQYFKQFGLVVAFAVFFSLLVARLITPLLAAYFMRASRHEDKEGWLLRAYTRAGALVGRAPLQGRGAGACASSPARSAASICCPRASCRPRTAAALLLAIELPPGSRMADTRAVTDAHRPQHPRAARREERVRQRRPRDGLGRRGAQGHARHQPGAQGASAS